MYITIIFYKPVNNLLIRIGLLPPPSSDIPNPAPPGASAFSSSTEIVVSQEILTPIKIN